MTTAPASRHDAIADALRSEILRGTYAPGDRLPAERDLAARLGANRGAVREALRKLEQQGLVVIRRGGGARVRGVEQASLEVARHLLFVDGRPNRPVMEQLLDVHEMLVVGAARLAVERATADEVARARALLTRLADPATGDDAFIDTAAALLDLIVGASGNLVLRLARNAVDPLFEERYREARKRLRPRPRQIAPIARELTRAIGERDAVAAEQATRRLLRLNRRRALDAIDALHAARPRAPEPATPTNPPTPEEEAHGR